jgi:O-methyltransferase involved in polyketide biosynthesis
MANERAEPAQQDTKPYGWIVQGLIYFNEPQAKQAAWFTSTTAGASQPITPVYTAAPSAPQAAATEPKALTNEQMAKIAMDHARFNWTSDYPQAIESVCRATIAALAATPKEPQ